jgi:hypothetical protein
VSFLSRGLLHPYLPPIFPSLFDCQTLYFAIFFKEGGKISKLKKLYPVRKNKKEDEKKKLIINCLIN